MTEDWQEAAFKTYIAPGSWGRFLGFWVCCCQAVFSYLGVELVAIAANEAERPRETLPHAVRRASYRIVFYYVSAIFVLGLNVSANDPILQNDVFNQNLSYVSPFVLMVQRAGIPVLAHVINAVALVASISVANANLYVSVKSFPYSLINCRVEHCMLSQTRAKLSHFS